MANNNHAEVQKRREDVSLCLQKSVTKPTLIAKRLKLDIKTVNNDLHWMRKDAKKWLTGHALEGYVFETKNTIDQMKDIETELQALRSTAGTLDEKLKVIKELRETINIRWVIQGEGPTLMYARMAKEKAKVLGR